ncbi:cytochrome c biogenesis CcdA family protein [Oceanivirga miroungae]|uniref:Cytochrome c biogenesis protein transmembrane protein n=1 Tax=Oceanivirga miroungae TaxID=1130046 RepID=A0A6I8M4B8_9FUSO|nr:cytochrome c biogenesis protein CcdA [Oceanivirga miroungae]VWL84754.1 cytochrome c biogenesis protein transmembrane protein [Oceanivirga miroungae]
MLISAYLGGMFMFFSPCIFPILPVYLAILEKDGKKVLNTFLFILGLSLTFIALGFSLGTLGSLIYSPKLRFISGIIIILLGLQQYGVFEIKSLNKSKVINIKRKFESPALESFVLGLSFSLGWTPCIGPILAAIILTATDSALATYGAFLLAIFVLGFVTPFLAFTIFYDKVKHRLNFIKRNLETIKKLSAILVILMGVALIFDKLALIVAFFNSISG